MMDWTDRHCRFFHRRFSRRTLLFTEMITARAVLHGDRERLLAFDPEEHPVALQLGGSEPAALAEATRIARAFGYDEINLNVGCPSDRVRSGCFGAVLMKTPALVAECVAEMQAAAGPVPVSVKCRIGVDSQVPEEVLPAFLERMAEAGVRRIAIHARKAWLDGLSPKENREVPPLDHALVVAMKAAYPELEIIINGGIDSLAMAQEFIQEGLDGVMIGRAAYVSPWMLGAADRCIFGEPVRDVAPETAVREMMPYIERELRGGTRLHAITRHMLGSFHGRPGARAWRRRLSEEIFRPGVGPEHVLAALADVERRTASIIEPVSGGL